MGLKNYCFVPLFVGSSEQFVVDLERFLIKQWKPPLNVHCVLSLSTFAGTALNPRVSAQSFGKRAALHKRIAARSLPLSHVSTAISYVSYVVNGQSSPAGHLILDNLAASAVDVVVSIEPGSQDLCQNGQLVYKFGPSVISVQKLCADHVLLQDVWPSVVKAIAVGVHVHVVVHEKKLAVTYHIVHRKMIALLSRPYLIADLYRYSIRELADLWLHAKLLPAKSATAIKKVVAKVLKRVCIVWMCCSLLLSRCLFNFGLQCPGSEHGLNQS